MDSFSRFVFFQMWNEISQVLSEKLRSLELVLNDLEKVEICTGLNPDKEADAKVIKRGQSSLTSCSVTLKSRVVNTLKLVNHLNS